MKAYILLPLALLLISASASFGVNVQSLIATKGSGIISETDLKYIIQSQYNEYVVTTTFFTAGDLNKDGKLSLTEFGVAYSAFISFVTGQTIEQALILARWELATLEENSATVVDLVGFTFVVTLDLRFIYNNYNLFNGNLDVLSATIAKVEGALAGTSTNTLITAAFFGFDYDKNSFVVPAEFRSGFRIIGYILGVNLSYTSGILNDFFASADTNNDGEISLTEAVTFINSHLALIEGLLQTVSSR